LIVLNGLVVFTVLIIFIVLICCLFSFLRSFFIALVASIVLNMLAELIVLLVDDVFYRVPPRASFKPKKFDACATARRE
jgi:hypothetical protein